MRRLIVLKRQFKLPCYLQRFRENGQQDFLITESQFLFSIYILNILIKSHPKQDIKIKQRQYNIALNKMYRERARQSNPNSTSNVYRILTSSYS